MRQHFLFGFAWIHIRAARDVHIGSTSGDVDEALLVHVAEIAGAEPSITEGLRVRLGVVEIARENRRTADADFARLARWQLPTAIILDRDLHSGAREAAT